MIRSSFSLRPLLCAVSLAACALFAPLGPGARGQAPGSYDPTLINPDIDASTESTLATALNQFTAFAIALQTQPDGTQRLIIAGDNATLYRMFLEPTAGLDTSGNPTIFEAGTVDPTFNASTSNDPDFGGPGRIIYALEVQPDGKMVIAGNFGNPVYNTALPASNIGRINADGSVELAVPGTTGSLLSVFNTNAAVGFDASVDALLRRTNAGPTPPILVGGFFQHYNNGGAPYMIELNDDATPNTAFNTALGSGPNNAVYNFAEELNAGASPVTATGRIYVAGGFTSFNGNSKIAYLARLNADGSLDTTFAPAINGTVFTVAVQPRDGKILIGGQFSTVGGVASANIARLNTDGTLDTTFNCAATTNTSPAINPVAVYMIKVQTDGEILVGGQFLELDGVSLQYLGRVNPDGSVDTTFNPGTTLQNATQTMLTISRPTNTGNTSELVVASTRRDKKIIFPNGDRIFPLPVVGLYDTVPLAQTALVPPFFLGSTYLGADFYSLTFADGQSFGTYNTTYFPTIYNSTLGFLYFIDANDGNGGAYFFDLSANSIGAFYTSPSLYPYLFDFNSNAFYFYFVGTTNPRVFYNYGTGMFIYQ